MLLPYLLPLLSWAQTDALCQCNFALMGLVVTGHVTLFSGNLRRWTIVYRLYLEGQRQHTESRPKNRGFILLHRGFSFVHDL
jgi:hypothetical protein